MTTVKKRQRKEYGPDTKPPVLLQQSGTPVTTYVLIGVGALAFIVCIYFLIKAARRGDINFSLFGGAQPPQPAGLSAITEVSSDVLTNLSEF